MYLKRLFTVLALVVSIAFVTGKYFDNLYKKRWEWIYFGKMNEALSEKNYDILFLGNSRMQTGINPYYVDSITGLNSYNLGVGAADEQEIKLLSTVYLQHHAPPAIMVLGLDDAMLTKYNILKERFAYLFYLHNDTVSAFMKKNGFPTSLIKSLPFMKYAFFDEYNRTSIFINGPEIPLFGHNIYKGFINVFPEMAAASPGITAIKNKVFLNTLPGAEKINDTAASVIRQTVELFLQKGSKVILLFLPQEHRSGQHQYLFHSFFVNLASQYNLPVIRMDTSSLFPKKYFIDINHLNEPGSRILSYEVANYLKQSE